ncbi:hypothetical protein [Gemmatimonas sp.]|uniref:hypothetical protein n=1 Tax=Gemmatimonas sp. TaxID=1962908 RepID=UPI0037C16FB1
MVARKLTQLNRGRDLRELAILPGHRLEALKGAFPRLNEAINAKRSVTPATALRLAEVTGMSADFWLGLQQD